MNSKNIKFSVFLIIIMFSTGCKSAKTIIANGTLNSNLSTKQIIKETNSKKSNFKTLAARLKIETNDGKKSQSVTVSMRMEKDKTIWLSKLGIVKALITPNRVAFYNTWDKTYFDGDFSYISELLGTELDFKKVQNLLLGETILDLEPKGYKGDVNDKSYVLSPKRQDELYEIFFLINPSFFKLDSQQISQSEEKRHLQIDYTAYQKVETETLPKILDIVAVQANEELNIDLEFKSVSLNQKLKFPFRIPSGYDEIELK
ncbi:DUF4292 domain-containing protein [Pontimicrobium sp. MEBiC01747]